MMEAFRCASNLYKLYPLYLFVKKNQIESMLIQAKDEYIVLRF